MNQRNKILLSTKDIITKGEKDIYLNINLQRTYNEFKKSEYDNDFDLQKQFNKERNASRNFRIYGVVDSVSIDCDNIELKVQYGSNLIKTVKTKPLISVAMPSINVFGKKKGKYLIELDNYDKYNNITIVISNVPNTNQPVNAFKQQLVFYDAEGVFVDYGTETIELGEDGQSIEIDNNFPFFYDKHWINKDLNLSSIMNISQLEYYSLLGMTDVSDTPENAPEDSNQSGSEPGITLP